MSTHRLQFADFDWTDDVALPHCAEWPDFLNIDASAQHSARNADGLIPASGYVHDRGASPQ